MNILPYTDTSTFWEGPHLVGGLITLGIGLLVIICVTIIQKRSNIKTDLLTTIPLIAFISVFVSMLVMVCIGITDSSNRYIDYSHQVSEQMKAQGFEIANGYINLHTNKQSTVLIEHQSKMYNCSVFTFQDVTKEVVFSCGPLQQSLTEIANSK